MATKKSARPASASGSNLSRSGATAARAATEKEFNPDYTQIVSDLRRIGMLAGIIIVVLVALSFII